MSDERLGKPSASSFSLDALCPGRQDLLQSLGEIAEPVDEFAERGTRLHEAWQHEGRVDAITFTDPEDTEIYERGLKLVNEAAQQWALWLEDDGTGRIKESEREQRFYLRDESGNITASGQADRHYICVKHGLVLDFKSLWCHSLTPAELNWQLLLLAVLVAKEYDLTHIRCAFVKPMFNKLDIVDYNAEDLKRAEFAVQQVIWAIKHTPQRRPGAHCSRCRGATACFEAQAWALLPSVQSGALLGHVTPTFAKDLVERLNLSNCVRIWETATSRHNIEDAIAVRLKSLPLGELAELGLTFGEPRINRPITDPRNAYTFMVGAGISAEHLWAAVDLGKGKVTEIVQESLKLTKKAAEQWIKDKLTPFMTEKPCEKPLVKI